MRSLVSGGDLSRTVRRSPDPRPLPADISANLKQAVSKAIAQKALLSLADKGLLTKKDYGQPPTLSSPRVVHAALVMPAR